MDINDTRFHLLLGEKDWTSLNHNSDSSPEEDLFWDEKRACLSLKPLLFRFPSVPGEWLFCPEDRRGADRDRYGNWYWIDENETEIRILSANRRQSEHFWSADDLAITCDPKDDAGAFRPEAPLPPVSLKLSGLAVTGHHYLVAGVLDPAGLLIFDLHAGGPPIQITWPLEISFVPFDIARTTGGGVVILDRKERRYWMLDRYFRIVSVNQKEVTFDFSAMEDFQPEIGPHRHRPIRRFPPGISLNMSSPVETTHPVAIESLPDGTVLILDNPPGVAHSVIYRYCLGKQLESGVSLERGLEKFLNVMPSPENPNPYALRGHDIAFLSDREVVSGEVSGVLYIVASSGNQTFAFDLKADKKSFSLELLDRYFPMRLFSGKALVAANKTVYYDLKDRWLKIVEQPLHYYKKEAVFETCEFDGKKPDCAWHRLFLDACIPQGGEILVESRVSNSRDRLSLESWQKEPSLHRRLDGSELPYYKPFPSKETKQDDIGTWELLCQQALGRYLQLKITLRGTGRRTPLLRALRVYYPRFSYLKEYLPAVYQKEKHSASFLERFLANMEGFYTTFEGKIAEAQTLFDVQTVPTEYMNWLAGWFGVVLDPSWDDARRRLFLSHAVELFTQRGTMIGLIRAIRLAIDPCPDETLFEENQLDCVGQSQQFCTFNKQIFHYSVRIVERFLIRSTPGVVYGDPTDITGPGLITKDADWTPDQGADPLNQRYRDYLQSIYRSEEDDRPDIEKLNDAWGVEEKYGTFDEIHFSPVPPKNKTAAKDWRHFTRHVLGFTYAEVVPDDRSAYQEFLAHRYRQVARLNLAYGLSKNKAWGSFEQIELPGEDEMPSGGPRLYDWVQFVSLALPIRRNAHRFVVLVPTDPQDDLGSRQRQLDLVQYIVNREKPTHTKFEVKPYWALFRVGEVRLGLDTLLGIGSRFIALVLGKSKLAESYLASSHPWDVTDRIVSDRDGIGPNMEL